MLISTLFFSSLITYLVLEFHRQAKLEITELQKIQQEKFNKELKISQKEIESLIQTVLESFNSKKFILLIFKTNA